MDKQTKTSFTLLHSPAGALAVKLTKKKKLIRKKQFANNFRMNTCGGNSLGISKGWLEHGAYIASLKNSEFVEK